MRVKSLQPTDKNYKIILQPNRKYVLAVSTGNWGNLHQIVCQKSTSVAESKTYLHIQKALRPPQTDQRFDLAEI